MVEKKYPPTQEILLLEFQTHKKTLQTFLGHLAGNLAAEDLLQETFARAWKSLGQFRGESTLKTWLFQIAHNLAVDLLRKNQRSKDLMISAIPVDPDTLDASGGFQDVLDDRPWNLPEEALERQEMLECIAQFIDQLQPGIKALIILREIQETPLSELSAILEITPGNLRVRLHRCREILRKALNAGCHIYQGRQGKLMCEKK